MKKFDMKVVNFLIEVRINEGLDHWPWAIARDEFKMSPLEMRRWQQRVNIRKALEEGLNAAETKETPKKVKAVEKKENVEDNELITKDGVIDSNIKYKDETSMDASIEIEEQLLDGAELTEMKILEILNLSPDVWEVKNTNVRRSTWQAQTKVGIEILNSLKISASVSKRTDVSLSYFMERLYPELQKTMHLDLPEPVQPKKPVSKDNDNIAIVTIADLHLGKLAWAPETGENYDYKIAQQRFNHIIDESCRRLKDQKVEKIIFFWSQDFFHYDHEAVTTTAGTRQDTDVRWQKLFMEGVKMLKDAIIKLQNIAPVTSFYTRSNHDTQVAYYALFSLNAFFKGAGDRYDVIIDESPSPRKYFKYGVNLFGFGHGDKEKSRIGEMMSLEVGDLWEQNQYREMFLGHFHHQIVKEQNGVILRYLSSPSGTDSWHNDSGYIGNFIVANVFIRNKHDGPVATLEIPIWSNQSVKPIVEQNVQFL